MVIRTLYGIEFTVDSPSHYRCLACPNIEIYFEGCVWVLADGHIDEEHASLDLAAQRLSQLADIALEEMFADHS